MLLLDELLLRLGVALGVWRCGEEGRRGEKREGKM